MAKKKMRENVLFDSDCYRALSSLNNDEAFGKVTRAILEYGFERKEPANLSEELNAIYVLATLKMDKAQRRYDSCVANGKLGGAPRGNSNASKKTKEQPENNQNDNQKSTKNQPENNQSDNQKTTKGTTRPSISSTTIVVSEITNDKESNNIFSLADCAGIRPKCYSFDLRQKLLPPAYEYHSSDEFGLLMLEIADTLLELLEYLRENKTIKFNSKTYTLAHIEELISQKGVSLVERLAVKIKNDDTIKNRPLYILQCLVSK